ncbi:MAG: helicase RepA family protein [Deltaproteobacteria bacterium]|jgi:hypothetical protein|nr:helicase RepA family protein [Deltaproteobacteria bacterium]
MTDFNFSENHAPGDTADTMSDSPDSGAAFPKLITYTVSELLEAARKNPRETVLPKLYAGKVGLLISPYGAGKSMFALQTCMSLAAGRDILGVRSVLKDDDRVEFPPMKTLFLNHRGQSESILSRMVNASKAFSDTDMRSIEANMSFCDLDSMTHIDVSTVEGASCLSYLAKGNKFMVVDDLVNSHRLNEDCGRDMARVMSAFENTARETGCAILLLHYTPDPSSPVRAGEMPDVPRNLDGSLYAFYSWLGYLARMTPEEARVRNIPENTAGRYVRFGISSIRGWHDKWLEREERWMKFGDDGVLSLASV